MEQRQMFGHLVIQRQAVAKQLAQQRRGEGLGGRADGVERIRRSGQLLLVVAVTESLCVDYAILVYHRHGKAGNVIIIEYVLQQGVDALEAWVGWRWLCP